VKTVKGDDISGTICTSRNRIDKKDGHDEKTFQLQAHNLRNSYGNYHNNSTIRG
jgi:hypothetical protein